MIISEVFDVCLLSYSMRVLPHHQNTGGFFIGVLEKMDWLPWQRKQRGTVRTIAMNSEHVLSTTEQEDEMKIVPKLEELATRALSCNTSTELAKDDQDNNSNVDGDCGVQKSTVTSVCPVATNKDTASGCTIQGRDKSEDERLEKVLGK